MINEKKYFNSIKKHFNILSKTDREYLYELKYRINLFSRENPDANFHDFVCRFGEPLEIVSSYYGYSDDILLKRLSIKQTFHFLAIIALTVAISFVLFASKSFIEGKDQYINLKEVVITEKN